MRTYRNPWHAASLVIAMILAFTGFGRTQERIGKTQQGLTNANTVNENVQEQFGLLTLSTGCSASLLSNDWAITAAHCVEVGGGDNTQKPDPKRPGQNILVSPINSVRLSATWGGGQTQTATRIETFRPQDVAIIRTVNPFRVNGSTKGYSRGVYQDDLPVYRTWLPAGTPLRAFGRGIFMFARKVGFASIPSMRDGRYREANFAVAWQQGMNLYWFRSPGAQIAGGDSGGPSFTQTSRGYLLVGVHSLTHAQYLPGKSITWDWVTATPEAADASVRWVWNAIKPIVTASRSIPTPAVATGAGLLK